MTLEEFVGGLQTGDVRPLLEREEWADMIGRISTPGIAEVDEETWWYFLEVLPPKYQHGNLFAFAEGAEPLRLFWRKGGHCFCCQLTQDETQTFCGLSGIDIPW